MKNTIDRIVIYTDGSCNPNPGPGGWAALIITADGEKTISGGDKETTNNRMELTAAIKALKTIKEPARIEIFTDSQYLKRGIEDWMPKWLTKNWRGSNGKIANQDLWIQLLQGIGSHKVTWRWLKGHMGNPRNHQVDQMAKKAIPY
jgi:ribonuclease HI